MKKLVVFDLDGTLNQTNLYAVDAHKNALAEYGVTDKSDDFIAAQFGARPDDYIIEYFSGSDYEITEDFMRVYNKKATDWENTLIQKNGKPFDGVEASIQKLIADGYEIAVCSNSSVRYITLVLDTLKLREYINYIQPLLPNMIKDQTLAILLKEQSPDFAVMVGDRVFDMNAARANKIPFIGCKYGYSPQEMDGADIEVYSGEELYDAVKKLDKNN